MAAGYDDDDQIIPGLASGLLGFGAQAPNPIGLGAALSQFPVPAASSGLIPLQIPAPQLTNPPSPPMSQTPAPSNAAQAPDPMQTHQQRTIYGETAGLYPQLVTQPGHGGIYNSKNWEGASADALKTAREWMAGVRLVNPIVNESGPNLANGVERMAWNNAVDAAQGAQASPLPAGVNHFFIRQVGAGPAGPLPGKWPDKPKLFKTFGPFLNVGGGDVPKGNQTYIDFYRKEP